MPIEVAAKYRMRRPLDYDLPLRLQSSGVVALVYAPCSVIVMHQWYPYDNDHIIW
ncbi:uncharacterized protein BO96DRAFT_416664 [Aspergillus niger CBS 101883]|uniref:uncharacterized protein n=1 Tax=Aspergillus lacticoffeatus (strain CBS 101883) TaxID=1450533 RepID=UPI000D7F5EEF|nr:uncharacterized protein BO96DRAFT_416664 [Aspergillus niger CBS 101883]PYH51053.1 hypothetical protein BO96DRAFT_416664 [Aspergillus niger CBS 101883]